MEMGTGKTKTLLDTAAYMYDQGWITGLLIFANKGSYQNWVTEGIPEHLPDHIEYDVAMWRSVMNKKQRKEVETVMRAGEMCLKIFVMNIEALSHKRSTEVALNFAKVHQCFTVIDESTTIKNPKSNRTKAAWKIGSYSAVRRIMTGSVVDNKPLDAFAQFQFLNNGSLGFTSFTAFRAHFADLITMDLPDRKRPFKAVTGYKNIDDLHIRLAKHSFIIKKEECLDLPPKMYEKFYVELSPAQEKLYKELKDDMKTEIEGQMASVKVILTKLLRLHQLVCGHLKDDEGKIHSVTHNRLSALDSILDEVSGQVLIWANYRADIMAISNHLKKIHGEDSVITYFGDTTEEERDRAKSVLKRGNDTEGVRFFVGNPQTGGYGLTLTGANTVVYYSNSFDAEKRSQSEDRAHRIGQTDKVTYIDIVCEGTVDEKILGTLRDKKSLSDVITTSNWEEFF